MAVCRALMLLSLVVCILATNSANKVVLVTGGSAGIGATTAITFAQAGYYVVIVGRNETNLAKVAAAYPGRILPLRLDINDDNQAAAAIQRTIDQFGRLDVLVNNAGIIRLASILQGNILKAYDEVMNTNLRAVIQLTTLAAPHLIRTKGNIINISGIWSLAAPKSPTLPTAISKIGLNHFALGAAAELAPHGVRVNTISPGAVRSEFLLPLGRTWEEIAASSPLKRGSETQEIADMIFYLASDKAVGITGSNFVIDNGGLLR